MNGILYHSYYEKVMKSQYTVMQRTAMSEHQKMAILGNELVRRLSNIHREVVAEELVPVTEHYISQLKNSGYSRKQAREVVICGMVGWLRKLERREKQGQGQYLAARLTLEERDEKKLLEKTSWYKENGKRKRENAESKIIYNPPKRARRGTLARKTGRGKTTTTNKQEQGKSKIKAVMFIPYTRQV